MDTQDLISAFDTFAPTYLANDWDNVGLLVGSPDWPANKIVLTIDLTEAVLHEAITSKVDVIAAMPLDATRADSVPQTIDSFA